MRLGIAGLGSIGALHAQNLRGTGVSLLVYDLDPSRAAQIAASTGAEVASNRHELLESSIDGLVVATSTPAHAGLVRSALDARIPVFCEKPISPTIREGVGLVATAERLRVPMQVGFQRRSDPELKALRGRIQQGADGPLIGIRVISSSWQPPPPGYLSGSGGLFRDKLAHELDLLRWLTGREIEELTAIASGSATGWIGELGDMDTASVGFLMTGGIVGQIWVARMAPTRFDLRVEVVCGERLLVAGSWDRGGRPGFEWTPSPWPDFVHRFHKAYRAELESFLRLVGGEGENVCPGSDALASEMAAAAAERAWRERRIVRVGELAPGVGAPF